MGNVEQLVTPLRNAINASRGLPRRLALPNRRFHRHVGAFADRTFVSNLMARPVYDPKQMASWIAAPKQGIKGRPVDFEYVRRNAL